MLVRQLIAVVLFQVFDKVFSQVVSFGLNSFKLIAIILEKLFLNVADLGLVVDSGLLRESVLRVETMIGLVFNMMIILFLQATVVWIFALGLIFV
jgi:hypothetical protein